MKHPAPVTDLYTTAVIRDWIDDNQHMNVAYYSLAFDMVTDRWLDYVGLDRAHRQACDVTTMAAECHIIYLREVSEGDPLRFTTQLLDYDAKRIHYIHGMYHAEEGYLAATSEQLTLHLDRGLRRVAPMADSIRERLAGIMDAHRVLPRPPQAGRVMGVKAGRPV